MKTYIKFIKIYLNFLSYIAPKYGGKVAIKIFQKVRIRKIKKREEDFYKKAKTFTLKQEVYSNSFSINYYELGNPNNHLVFLVHGWDSNAGSLSQFAFELAKTHYVISLDLPAHAYSKGTHTNLFECKTAFINLINHIQPKQKFSVIAHSFGAAVITYALAETNYHINKIVLLSANNKIKIIFDDYQKLIGFNDRIYLEVSKWIKRITNEELEDLILSEKAKKIKFNNFLIIHDKFDKVLPFKSATEIKEAIPKATLIPFEKIGHYRMLWNKEVLNETIRFIRK